MDVTIPECEDFRNEEGGCDEEGRRGGDREEEKEGVDKDELEDEREGGSGGSVEGREDLLCGVNLTVGV